MAKRKPTPPPGEGEGGCLTRIEFQCDPELIAQLDEARKRLGLTRAAYVRMATLDMMRRGARDAREGGEG
jgi:hypothetical protein